MNSNGGMINIHNGCNTVNNNGINTNTNPNSAKEINVNSNEKITIDYNLDNGAGSTSSFYSSNSNSNSNSNNSEKNSKSNTFKDGFQSFSSPLKSKRVKQYESLLTQKIVNLNELKSMAWKGIPFGN